MPKRKPPVPVQSDQAEASESANRRVSKALVSDLAYFLQEKGLCEEYGAWYDEMPPIERLLRKKQDARNVWTLLEEGKQHGFAPADVAGVLDAESHP